ncbi:MAG: DUF6282 family protein [Peptococcaceae bacterium]|jgi:hypothetical protein|nr:DUF6282 family protein [Peptococcaceae bacterium]MDH7523804.1 DUF6282 family protein [Peptococcaceae bacterium]
MENYRASELLKGAVDIHVHTSPSLFPRSVDDFELAEHARKAGMKGFIIKAHEGSTVERAITLSKQTGLAVGGCLVLNQFVGGFNPYAVELALKMGAKIIWMPTISARNHLQFHSGGNWKAQKSSYEIKVPDKGYSVLDDDGKILNEVKEILALIAENGGALGTGHLSVQEVISLVDEACKMGIKKLLVAHPELDLTKTPLSVQQDLAKKGAYLEKSMLPLMPAWKNSTPEETAGSIRAVGAERCIIQTDFGQASHPSPVEGFRMFIEELLKCGITEEEIRIMAHRNPCVFLE